MSNEAGNVQYNKAFLQLLVKMVFMALEVNFLSRLETY